VYMDEIIFIDIKESLSMLKNYRENLLIYMIQNDECETIHVYEPHPSDVFRYGAPVEIWATNTPITSYTKKKIYIELLDLNHAIEALSILDNFYNGSTIPWSEISEDFFKILDMSIRVPRPYEIKDYKLL